MWPGAVDERPTDRSAERDARVRRSDRFWVLDYLVLALILAAAVLVVRLRNLNGAVMALSAMGTMLSRAVRRPRRAGRRALRGRGRGDRAAGAVPGRYRQGPRRRARPGARRDGGATDGRSRERRRTSSAAG